jgi:FdhD protein
LSSDVDVDAWRAARHVALSSSCGVCGKSNLDSMLESMNIPARETGLDDIRVSAGVIQSMPFTLAEFQQGFARTGGLHASALVTTDGEPVAVFEDIGRHNALDKLVGQSFLRGKVPLRNYSLFLSSRSSFELVQKTIMAGAPLLATVGSPSSLAIETARRYGVTLIGFVRDGRFNVYSGEWRIKLG